MTDAIKPMEYQAPADLLADRVILVTGAGSGLGRAAATAFAGHGATVVLLGRTSAKLEQLYDEIMARGEPEPGIVPMDLARATPDDIRQLLQALEDNYGRLDGLLHSAGLRGHRVPMEHLDPLTWQQLMQVNVIAAISLTRLLMPLLRLAPAASVVFTGDAEVESGQAGAFWGPYQASKQALASLASTLAEELGNTANVRVNTLLPPPCRTPMRASAFPFEDPASLVNPASLTPAYLYLMGDASIGINGQRLSSKSLSPET